MAVQQKQDFLAEDFRSGEDLGGKVCAVVDGDGKIIGTGIVNEKSPSNLQVTIDGVVYSFNHNGTGISGNASGLTLKLGVTQTEAMSQGNVTTTTNALVKTVDEDTGEVTYSAPEILDKTYSITIDNMNARDEFAVCALSKIMEKIDPCAVSKNEIAYYCEKAYLWASYMMAESSKARVAVKEVTTSSNNITEENSEEE